MRCPSCDSEQSGPLERCSQCRKSLLPGGDTGACIAGIPRPAFAGGCILVAYAALAQVIEIPALGWLVAAPVGLILIILGVTRGFGAIPLAERFFSRGRSLAATDPDQAYVDFEKALELAERDRRPDFGRSVLAARAELHKKLGRRPDAVADLRVIVSSLRIHVGTSAEIRIAAIEKDIQKLESRG